MNTVLMDFFREKGCESPPRYNESDAVLFLRHREMCRRCEGLSKCREGGLVSEFVLSGNKTRASLYMGYCPERRTRDVLRKNEKLFADAVIPPGLMNCRLENYVTQGLDKSIRRAKEETAKAIETRRSLVLAGGVGTGKTHLAAAVAHAALDRGESALFISAIGYLHNLKATFDKGQTDLYARQMKSIKSVDCLVIDDMGAEKPSSWTIERIYDMVNTRVERRAQTIVTTNFTDVSYLLEHMRENPLGGMRIASRLVSWGWLLVEGKDYRAARAQQSRPPGV